MDIESVIKLFADDTSMYLCLDNDDVRAEVLNSDLEKISAWLENEIMSIIKHLEYNLNENNVYQLKENSGTRWN